jgi:hypothetical protein
MTDAVPLPIKNSLLSENIDFTPSNKQPRCWRGPEFRQQAGSGEGYYFIQMSEYLSGKPVWKWSRRSDHMGRTIAPGFSSGCFILTL